MKNANKYMKDHIFELQRKIHNLSSCEIEMAPYSFTIAHALGPKVQVICARSKGNVSVFRLGNTKAVSASASAIFCKFGQNKIIYRWKTA